MLLISILRDISNTPYFNQNCIVALTPFKMAQSSSHAIINLLISSSHLSAVDRNPYRKVQSYKIFYLHDLVTYRMSDIIKVSV